MVTKRDLGTGYLVGTGLGLACILVGRLLVLDQPYFGTLIGTATGIVLSGTLVYAGCWLLSSDLGEEHVWTVSRWGAFGLAIPTAVALALLFLPIELRFAGLEPSMLINHVASGALAGVLVGAVTELHDEHDTARRLNQRNRVLNRVLRHNVRNDMNVIRGYVDLLAEAVDDGHEGTVQVIRETTAEVVELSKMARRIERLEADVAEADPVDAAAAARRQVEAARETHPDAEIETDLPEEAWVDAGGLLDLALNNVIENAIEHHDGEPRVSVVATEADECLELRVADDGPGLPEEERRVLDRGVETALEHGSGMGLWLVAWILDSHGGELAFEENDPRGTVAVMRLPRSAPGGRDGLAALASALQFDA